MICVFFAWLGLAANFTVIGSAAPGGFWPFRFLTASSASARLSNRMKATPRDTPSCGKGKTDLWHVPDEYFSILKTNKSAYFCIFAKVRKPITCRTCRLVNKYTRVNDASIAWEHVLYILLGHGLGQAAYVQVGIFYCVWAGPCVWNLATGGNAELFKTLLSMRF